MKTKTRVRIQRAARESERGRSGKRGGLWRRLLVGLLLSGGVAGVAYRRHSLSRSGVPGAIAAGTTIFGFGGWDWGCSLIFFFVSSSLLSHFRARQKERTASDKFSKGSQRDLLQVVANGGVASALALGYGLSATREGVPADATRDLLQAGFTGALATATADTWATELGVLSAAPPRLVTNGRRVAPGTSGGITPLGTLAAAAGALALGAFFWLLQLRPGRRPYGNTLPLIGLLSGLAGSLFDSLLGATVQAIYYCPNCDTETEQRIHRCGTRTQHLRGLRWMNNDAVNFLATLFGGLAALLLRLPFLPRARSR